MKLIHRIQMRRLFMSLIRSIGRAGIIPELQVQPLLRVKINMGLGTNTASEAVARPLQVKRV